MPGPSIRSSQIISICTSWNFLEVKANQNTMHALPDGSQSKKSCPCLNLKACIYRKLSYNDPVLSSLTANYACPPVVCDHCTLRSSERVVPTSSAPLLTNQHENADGSFIDLGSYTPEISWVRSSKLPPFLGVAITI